MLSVALFCTTLRRRLTCGTSFEDPIGLNGLAVDRVVLRRIYLDDLRIVGFGNLSGFWIMQLQGSCYALSAGSMVEQGINAQYSSKALPALCTR